MYIIIIRETSDNVSLWSSQRFSTLEDENVTFLKKLHFIKSLLLPIRVEEYCASQLLSKNPKTDIDK